MLTRLNLGVELIETYMFNHLSATQEPFASKNCSLHKISDQQVHIQTGIGGMHVRQGRNIFI
jgi:hypothetical protein